EFSKTFRNGEHSEVTWIAVGDFMPVERRGYTRVFEWPNGICRAGRTILGVLVVVKEHTMTFLLPPLRTRQSGNAALDGTRQRESRASYFRKRPSRLYAHIHVHSA